MPGHKIKLLCKIISYYQLKVVVYRVGWGEDIIKLMFREMNESIHSALNLQPLFTKD